MEDFGGLVRTMRRGKGYTQEEVARRIGTQKGYLSSIENGKVNPPAPGLVKKLARVLGADAIELLLMSYIQKAPKEIRGILDEGAKMALGAKRKASAPDAPGGAAFPEPAKAAQAGHSCCGINRRALISHRVGGHF